RPTGITVALAREVAARLEVVLQLHTFTAAKDAFASLVSAESTLGFMAIEPARAEHVQFTEAYVLIEGAFVVPAESSITCVADVDTPGTRVGVKQGSAYDLYLSRTLE